MSAVSSPSPVGRLPVIDFSEMPLQRAFGGKVCREGKLGGGGLGPGLRSMCSARVGRAQARAARRRGLAGLVGGLILQLSAACKRREEQAQAGGASRGRAPHGVSGLRPGGAATAPRRRRDGRAGVRRRGAVQRDACGAPRGRGWGSARPGQQSRERGRARALSTAEVLPWRAPSSAHPASHALLRGPRPPLQG